MWWTIGKRWPTIPYSDRHLQYKRLSHLLFHDKAVSLITLTRQNTCAEVYVTDFCWSRSFSIKSKLSCFIVTEFQQDLYLIMLRSWRKVNLLRREGRRSVHWTWLLPIALGRIERKPKSMSLNDSQEGGWLRWGVRRYYGTNASSCGSKICLSIAHNVYQLKGEVPETVVTGATYNISHLCKFAWYDWVMYNNDVDFLEDKETFGWYLGRTDPGIGSTMSYQIFQPSQRVVHH